MSDIRKLVLQHGQGVYDVGEGDSSHFGADSIVLDENHAGVFVILPEGKWSWFPASVVQRVDGGGA